MFTTYVRMFSDIINRKVLPATCLHSYFTFLTSSFGLRNWKKRNPFHILPLIVASIAFARAPCASFNHRIQIYFVFDGAVFVGYHVISPSCHRKKPRLYRVKRLLTDICAIPGKVKDRHFSLKHLYN